MIVTIGIKFNRNTKSSNAGAHRNMGAMEVVIATPACFGIFLPRHLGCPQFTGSFFPLAWLRIYDRSMPTSGIQGLLRCSGD